MKTALWCSVTGCLTMFFGNAKIFRNPLEYYHGAHVYVGMNNTPPISRVFRWIPLAAVLVSSLVSVGCMTTYDAYGRPMQTVDPGVAVAGVVTAGVLGYAIASHNGGYCYGGHYHGGSYHGGYYHGRYYGPPRYRY